MFFRLRSKNLGCPIPPNTFIFIAQVFRPSYLPIGLCLMQKSIFTENHAALIKGTSLGLICSLETSDVFVHSLEMHFLDMIPGLILYRRYRDDVLIISETSELEFHSFFEYLNSVHGSIKFTMEVSTQELNFLDITIYKGKNFEKDGTLDTKTFFKPTETFQYINVTSAHPDFCLRGFVKGEILRHKRNCNNVPDFTTTVLKFYKHLRQRGYSKELFLDQLEEVLKKNKAKNKPHERSLFFKTKYNPSMPNQKLRKILNKHWHVINEDAELKPIFPSPPTISFARNKNLREFLVKSRLEEKESENEDLKILISFL
jgi:hypothetical protein